MKRHDLASLTAVLASSLLMAAASTLGDVIWFELNIPHRTTYGLAHGAILCLAIGLYIGALAHRPWRGASGGAAIGLLSAGSYYVLAPATGPPVMFVIWMALWVMTAVLTERLEGLAVRWPKVLGRGGLAAVGSGSAFYAVSGIWFGQPAGGRSYALHFASWTLVYLPAFLAILYGRPGSPRATSSQGADAAEGPMGTA